MKKLTIALLLGLTMVTSACGGDSAAPTSSPVLSYPPVDAATLTSLQKRVVDITYAAATAQGKNIDGDCLVSVGAQFSDADAALIDDANTNAATEPNEQPTPSAQGAALIPAIKACVLPATATTVTPVAG